jgi:hypothetical protein
VTASIQPAQHGGRRTALLTVGATYLFLNAVALA